MTVAEWWRDRAKLRRCGSRQRGYLSAGLRFGLRIEAWLATPMCICSIFGQCRAGSYGHGKIIVESEPDAKFGRIKIPRSINRDVLHRPAHMQARQGGQREAHLPR